MLRTAILLAVLLGLLPSCSDDAAHPDVVIVVIDTLRPDRLGAYGCDRELTPNLDRIAAAGAVFRDCQSPAPWTAPSLISLMTSTRPGVHGVTHFPVPGTLAPRVRTLAEELQAAGYATAAFTEGGYAQASFGLGRGFDVYPGHAGDEDGFHSNVEAPSRLKATLDRALIWLAEEREEPRLLFVHTYEVHHPLRPPESDLAALRPGYSEAQELETVRNIIDRWNRLQTIDEAGARALRRHSFHHDFANMPSVLGPDILLRACAAVGVPLEKDRAQLSPDELQWLQDLYDAEVRYTDRELGRLFEALDRNPGPNGTVLIVTSDHGEGLGAHGRLGHGEDYSEELMRVLLMIRAPGVTPGPVDELVRTIDVMPTALALAQVDPEDPAMQGRNLLPVLQGSAAASEQAVGQALSSRGGRDPRRSIKRNGMRLVLNAATGERWLYDLEADPGEQQNLTDARPDVARELEARLREELRRDALLRQLLGDPGTSEELTDDQFDELKRLGYVGD